MKTPEEAADEDGSKDKNFTRKYHSLPPNGGNE
jgi:hypothetical protein